MTQSISLNANRAVREETQPIKAKSQLGSTRTLQVGDLVALDATNHVIVDAGNQGTNAPGKWDTNLATTQGTFNASFVGVCLDQVSSDLGSVDVLVGTTGFYKYPCVDDATAYDIGAFFGPAKDPGDNMLHPQLLAHVATRDLAVGVLVAPADAHATSVTVKLLSTLI